MAQGNSTHENWSLIEKASGTQQEQTKILFESSHKYFFLTNRFSRLKSEDTKKLDTTDHTQHIYQAAERNLKIIQTLELSWYRLQNSWYRLQNNYDYYVSRNKIIQLQLAGQGQRGQRNMLKCSMYKESTKSRLSRNTIESKIPGSSTEHCKEYKTLNVLPLSRMFGIWFIADTLY